MDAIFSTPDNLVECQINRLDYQDKGAAVYLQGEQAQAFYYLSDGLIGLYHMLDNGKESLVRIYGPQQYFGFRTLFGDNTYHCTAKILQPSRIICIKPHNLHTFLSNNTNLARYLIQQLAIELQDAEHRLSQVSYQRTQERVSSSILYLKEKYPNHRWTHREIAEFAGCETETAIRIGKILKNSSKE